MAVAVATAGGLTVTDPKPGPPRKADTDTSDYNLAALRQPSVAALADRERLRSSRDQARRILEDQRRKAAAAAAEAARPKSLRELIMTALRAQADDCNYSMSRQRTQSLDRAQLRNSHTIIRVAEQLGLPPRAAVIALATAMQESKLRNIQYGHLDSVGLFQQRPSAGWGDVSEILDPEYAARQFYRRLQKIPGWQRLPLAIAAQSVQRSAFPSAYARWELLAVQTVARLVDDVDPQKLTCTA